MKAIEKTSLRHHMALWRESFLTPLYDQLGRDFAERARHHKDQAVIGGGNASIM